MLGVGMLDSVLRLLQMLHRGDSFRLSWRSVRVVVSELGALSVSAARSKDEVEKVGWGRRRAAGIGEAEFEVAMGESIERG